MVTWAETGRAAVLVGGQFGSEGKGLIAAYLARNIERDFGSAHIATTNAGAQAGHTTMYRNGKKFVCFHLPTAGVVNKSAINYINAGSIIDIDSLEKEILDTGVHPRQVAINPMASVITQAARDAERNTASSTTKIASTQKGVGQTIADKVMRKNIVAGMCATLLPFSDTLHLNEYLHSSKGAVTVEVPQGFSLSINHSGHYPYTTSRDCWVGSGLNDAGIHPKYIGKVCMVVRTYPIRVGNIMNEMGETLGNSGGFDHGSMELSWSNWPKIEPERTTVTKRVRRIATWSNPQYMKALALNRPDIVAVTFCNYCSNEGELSHLHSQMVAAEEKVLGRATQKIWSATPYVEDVVESYDEVVYRLNKSKGWGTNDWR